MKSSLPAPTKAQSKRMYIIKAEIGCIACDLLGNSGVWADAHHLLSGGRRISHDHTIPLCKLHHNGKDGIHTRKRWFRETFGSDDELLAVTNKLLSIVEENTI